MTKPDDATLIANARTRPSGAYVLQGPGLQAVDTPETRQAAAAPAVSAPAAVATNPDEPELPLDGATPGIAAGTQED